MVELHILKRLANVNWHVFQNSLSKMKSEPMRDPGRLESVKPDALKKKKEK